MPEFTEGDRVRIDIPDITDPDHDVYHGIHGTITTMLTDDVNHLTGDDQGATIYRVALETDETADFREHDLRSPVE